MAVDGDDRGAHYLVRVGEEFSIRNLLEVRSLVDEALREGHSNIVFDMSACISMDSSAIGLVLNLHKKCVEKGGGSGFLNPLSAIRDIISIAGVEDMIRIYESEDEIGRKY